MEYYTVMRINGIRVTELHRWSDEQLITGVEATEKRLESVWEDLAKYNGELALRQTTEIEAIHYPEWIPNE